MTHSVEGSFPDIVSSDGRIESVSDKDLHLWWIGLSTDDDSYRGMLATLSGAERERAARYHFEIDRKRFVIARSALRHIVGRSVGARAEEVTFELGAHGKPVLAAPHCNSGVRFNLSHSADVAVCAIVRRGDVGVDVEQVHRQLDVMQIATQFFSAAEQRMLEHSDDRQVTFARIWVRKEAYLKATGVGIGADLQGFTVSLAARSQLSDESRGDLRTWTIQEIVAPSEYAAAVVSSNALRVVEHSYRP